MNLLYYFLIFEIYLPGILSLFSNERILCNQSISPPNIDLSITTNQNLSLHLCDLKFNITLEPNKYFFSSNITVDESIPNSLNTHFSYNGHILNDNQSSISLIIYPQLQIYIYSNGTYYYYLSLLNNSAVTLKFSQQQLLQYYPQLVNDSLWRTLQQEEENYKKKSFIIHDLHFIYELLTLRCESDKVLKPKTVSFCSLALLIDRILYENVFYSNIYHIYSYIEHFNFLLRTLTDNQYRGFAIKNLQLIDSNDVTANKSLDLLHQLSTDTNIVAKDYCLVHQMLLTTKEKESHVLGYQSSVQTYDIGGICSSPFSLTNNNQTDEYNLNTGLSILNENITKNLSLVFNGLMKTSYLFLRQMGLNLTLCSTNTTRKGFFHFNTEMSLLVPYCINLLSSTLRQGLEQRAHLCFNHINIDNNTNQSMKQDDKCQHLIDTQPSMLIDGKHRRRPYIENALNDNRRSEWFEGNIVGMILTFSLLLWIPVSCFVHFFVDEINKRSFMDKQQDMETLPMNEQMGITKQTQTD